MTKPLSLYEQTQQNWFKATHKIAIFYAQSKYDACWKPSKKNKGEYEQGLNDLSTVTDDCDLLKNCLEKYQIRESDAICIYNNPTKFRNTLDEI